MMDPTNSLLEFIEMLYDIADDSYIMIYLKTRREITYKGNEEPKIELVSLYIQHLHNINNNYLIL